MRKQKGHGGVGRRGQLIQEAANDYTQGDIEDARREQVSLRKELKLLKRGIISERNSLASSAGGTTSLSRNYMDRKSSVDSVAIRDY